MSAERLMFVRFELRYMLPMRMPSIIDTPSPGIPPCTDTCVPVWSPWSPPTSRLPKNAELIAGISCAMFTHDPPDGSSLNVFSSATVVWAVD